MRKGFLLFAFTCFSLLTGTLASWSAGPIERSNPAPPACCVGCECGCAETGVCDCATFTGDEKKPDHLEGIYAIVGKDRDRPYTGVAIIRKTTEEQYMMQSVTTALNEEGKPVSGGEFLCVGIREGKILSFAYKIGPAKFGVTVYKINDDGTLSGRYTIFPQNTDVMTETLKKIAPLPKPCCETSARGHFTACHLRQRKEENKPAEKPIDADEVADVSGEWIDTQECLPGTRPSEEFSDRYVVHQYGRNLSITLDDKYVAGGTIRQDGKILLFWQDGRIGTYRLTGSRIFGLTNILPDVHMNDEGEINCGIPDGYRRR